MVYFLRKIIDYTASQAKTRGWMSGTVGGCKFLKPVENKNNKSQIELGQCVVGI